MSEQRVTEILTAACNPSASRMTDAALLRLAGFKLTASQRDAKELVFEWAATSGAPCEAEHTTAAARYLLACAIDGDANVLGWLTLVGACAQGTTGLDRTAVDLLWAVNEHDRARAAALRHLRGEDKAAVPVSSPTPRTVVYCSAAPPRAVVEAVVVALDGTEGGRPVRVRLVWSARMRVEWTRHEVWGWRQRAAMKVAVERADGAAALRAQPSIYERELDPPAGADAYGGDVVVGQRGARCGLCGAWIRSVEVRS